MITISFGPDEIRAAFLAFVLVPALIVALIAYVASWLVLIWQSMNKISGEQVSRRAVVSAVVICWGVTSLLLYAYFS